MKTVSLGLAAALSLSLVPSLAHAQSEGCAPDAAGCTRAAVSFQWRQGLPVEFDFDTGWVPSGAPVQLRLRAVLAGNTQVRAEGQLVGSWYEPLRLRAVGTPHGGTLSLDYGVLFTARVRLALPVEGRTLSWEGAIPYVPRVDFRAMASSTFDPWAWQPTQVLARTMRQHLADVPLTDALVRIPGISGGLSFDAAGEVRAAYRSTAIRFGLDADPLTETFTETLARFTAGPFVEYQPQLEGTLDYDGSVHVYPSLYVSLAGRRWTLDLADLPIPVGPFHRDLRFDPAIAHLGLPDFRATDDVVDFGDVDVGRERERTVEIQNVGELDGRVTHAEVDPPFSLTGGPRTLPLRARSSFVVSFRPVRPGPTESSVVISTNDPDTPRVRVTVRGNGVGTAPTEPWPPHDASVPSDVAAVTDEGDGAPASAHGAQDGGCGCRTAHTDTGDGRSMAMALALTTILTRRRPRRSSALYPTRV